MTSPPAVKILDKALRVLMLFTPEQPEWGVTAIGTRVGMSKSTVHRILKVLEQHGFLRQDPQTRRFRLGLAGIELGRRAQSGFQLRSVALPIMEEMSAESGETVLLQVVSPEGDRVVCIERVERRRGLRLILDVGSTAPLHAGCSSKILLAYLDAESVNRVLTGRLEPLTPHTITDPEIIRTQLEDVRRMGFAVSFEETDEGVAGVSAPIRDRDNRVVAGLTISGPMTRINPTTMDQFTRIVMAGAARVTAVLAHGASLQRSDERSVPTAR